MAFFPANLPEVKITTLPVLKLNIWKCTFFPFIWLIILNYNKYEKIVKMCQMRQIGEIMGGYY